MSFIYKVKFLKYIFMNCKQKWQNKALCFRAVFLFPQNSAVLHPPSLALSSQSQGWNILAWTENVLWPPYRRQAWQGESSAEGEKQTDCPYVASFLVSLQIDTAEKDTHFGMCLVSQLGSSVLGFLQFTLWTQGKSCAWLISQRPWQVQPFCSEFH